MNNRLELFYFKTFIIMTIAESCTTDVLKLNYACIHLACIGADLGYSVERGHREAGTMSQSFFEYHLLDVIAMQTLLN